MLFLPVLFAALRLLIAFHSDCWLIFRSFRFFFLPISAIQSSLRVSHQANFQSLQVKQLFIKVPISQPGQTWLILIFRARCFKFLVWMLPEHPSSVLQPSTPSLGLSFYTFRFACSNCLQYLSSIWQFCYICLPAVYTLLLLIAIFGMTTRISSSSWHPWINNSQPVY